MTVKYNCAVCGKHLWNRDTAFVTSEMVGPQGLSRPDGQAAVHGERIAWCGCVDPAKGEPSLVAEEPVE